jgi:pimeloyl-ACP methyl ester carboxylesterase
VEIREEAVTLEGYQGYPLPAKFAAPGKVKDAKIGRVVVLIHGSGPNGMDEDLSAVTEGGQPLLFFKELSDALVGQGFAVLRYDKRSYDVKGKIEADPAYAESEEFTGFQANPLLVLVEDATAMAARAQERYPAARVYLVGHSQGTTIALQVAHTHPEIAGVGMIGYAGASLDTLVHEQLVYRSLSLFERLDADGSGAIDGQEIKTSGDPTAMVVWMQMGLLDLDADGLLSRDEYKAGNYSNVVMLDMIPSQYRIQEATYPTPASIIKGLEIPLAFFNGTLDNQTCVYYAMGIEMANKLTWTKDNLTFRYYDGLGHALDPRSSYDEVLFHPIDPTALADVAATLSQVFVDN